ncbi:MAG: sulfur carrier protein ThiS [Candidatus Omnitrophica bacterium]|nr:sulfur carrier protein ThiS [Candidatus Omnitrophota bacterium]
MKVQVNGDQLDVPEGMTMEQLLASRNVNPGIVVVEHNLTILKRDQLAAVILKGGDQVEIVRLVGGGSSQQSAVSSQHKPRHADCRLLVADCYGERRLHG